MAESNAQFNQINKESHDKDAEKAKQQQKQSLKYLDFVHVVAIQALICLSRLYDFAKANSGPLKPGVQTVEGTVKAVVGPVYEKFHDVPFDVLKLVDRKVGEAVEVVHRHVPSLVKQVSTQACTTARNISDDVYRYGVVNAAGALAKSACTKAEPAAKSLYNKYEPVAEHYAVSAWRSLNKLPIFPQVAQIVVPAVAHWTKRYNKALAHSAEEGYGFASYLPLVPTEKIAKVFGEGGKDKPRVAAASAQ